MIRFSLEITRQIDPTNKEYPSTTTTHTLKKVDYRNRHFRLISDRNFASSIWRGGTKSNATRIQRKNCKSITIVLGFYLVMQYWNGLPRKTIEIILKMSMVIKYLKKQTLCKCLRIIVIRKEKKRQRNSQFKFQRDWFSQFLRLKKYTSYWN